MQLGQAGVQLPYGMNPHDQLAYRQYQQSHAKPPYSYISLIAMAIQVKILFLFKITHENLEQNSFLTFYSGLSAKDVHIERDLPVHHESLSLLPPEPAALAK